MYVCICEREIECVGVGVFMRKRVWVCVREKERECVCVYDKECVVWACLFIKKRESVCVQVCACVRKKSVCLCVVLSHWEDCRKPPWPRSDSNCFVFMQVCACFWSGNVLPWSVPGVSRRVSPTDTQCVSSCLRWTASPRQRQKHHHCPHRQVRTNSELSWVFNFLFNHLFSICFKTSLEVMFIVVVLHQKWCPLCPAVCVYF